METSILNSTKKILGIPEDYTVFDHDVITHINATFSTLTQLGIGPIDGFMIEDSDPEWTDFIAINDPQLNAVKTYMYLKVRSYFDPPTTSFAIAAMDHQIQELEWRLNVNRENLEWVDPDPDPEEVVYE
jgi:hypothetical protein